MSENVSNSSRIGFVPLLLLFACLGGAICFELFVLYSYLREDFGGDFLKYEFGFLVLATLSLGLALASIRKSVTRSIVSFLLFVIAAFAMPLFGIQHYKDALELAVAEREAAQLEHFLAMYRLMISNPRVEVRMFKVPYLYVTGVARSEPDGAFVASLASHSSRRIDWDLRTPDGNAILIKLTPTMEDIEGNDRVEPAPAETRSGSSSE